VVEGTGLENRHTVYAVSRVRISPCPLRLVCLANSGAFGSRRDSSLGFFLGCSVVVKRTPGQVAEWLKAPVSKTGIPFTRYREFESLPVRFDAIFGAAARSGRGAIVFLGVQYAVNEPRDGWPSGLRRTPGKCVYVKSVPWVRIPPRPLSFCPPHGVRAPRGAGQTWLPRFMSGNNPSGSIVTFTISGAAGSRTT
jgi:hypothetical protein